jgi:hypothetical protein
MGAAERAQQGPQPLLILNPAGFRRLQVPALSHGCSSTRSKG